MHRLSRVFAASLLLTVPATAQDTSGTGARSAPKRVPFNVGERLEYDVKFGFLRVGSGAMEVAKLDTIRGREVWHTIFSVRGGIPVYHVDDRYESWIDTHTLSSLRYVQDINEGNYHPERRYEIFPERREYVENAHPPQPTVEHPLDDGSFLYFLRTIPLEVGKDTSFDNYFRPDRNPVRIRVVRRERIRVPAGEFNAIVVQPMFKSGIFAGDGQAEVWLSDDDNRIMLQMKSKLSFGSLNLYLKSYRPAPPAPPPAAAR
jgi:hypothetical protein